MCKTVLILSVSIAWIAGCASPDEGFSLPTGDAARGKAAFVALQCTECHRVRDAEIAESSNTGDRLIELGGEVDYVKSYEALVTGIINPSHRVASRYARPEGSEDPESPMRVYNDVMTVTQLIDIVTFLQEHYTRIKEPTHYPEYVYLP